MEYAAKRDEVRVGGVEDSLTRTGPSCVQLYLGEAVRACFQNYYFYSLTRARAWISGHFLPINFPTPKVNETAPVAATPQNARVDEPANEAPASYRVAAVKIRRGGSEKISAGPEKRAPMTISRYISDRWAGRARATRV